MIQFFRVSVPTSTLVLAVFETFIIVAAYLLSIDLLLGLDPTDYLIDNMGYLSVVLVAASILVGMYFQDLYSQVRVPSKLLLVQQLLMVAGIAFLIQAVISAVAPDFYLPFRIMVFGSSLSIVIILAGRLLFSAYILPRFAMERLVLLGNSLLLDDIAAYLEQSPQSGIEVVGRIRMSDLNSLNADGSRTKVESLMYAFNSNRAVVGMGRALDSATARELVDLRALGFSVKDASATLAGISNRQGLADLGPTQLLFTGEFEPSVRYLFFQSIIHRLVAAICIVIFLPLMLLIAVLVRLSSRGPVVERQVRAGQNGVPFPLHYFRLRPLGAAELNGMGRILLRTGLYALPQFFNVLLGQISLVGPRPLRPEFLEELRQYIPFYPHRLKVRPGMTGWSQIQTKRWSIQSNSIIELEYDLYYLKYASLTLDIFILLQALKNILLWGGQL